MLSKDSIQKFLSIIDEDFTPALSSKVLIGNFVDKIFDKAELIVEETDENIVGLVVLYCNDTENLQAYISLVGVLPECRGKGIAKKLMKQAVSLAKVNGMRTLLIHSNNHIAISLYQSFGFEVVEDGVRKLLSLHL